MSTSALCNKFSNDTNNFAKKENFVSRILELEQGVGEFEVLVELDCSPLCFKKEKSKGRSSLEVSRASQNAHCVRAANNWH